MSQTIAQTEQTTAATTPPTTGPPAASRAGDLEALGLRHILTDLLPPTVHAPDGPTRYTVSAVFTRRPTPGEIAALNGPEAHIRLGLAGFPDVALKVSDRRLEIANTNLDELADGLAAAIAGFLAHISTDDTTQTHVAADALINSEHSEERRSAAVRARVETIPLRGSDPDRTETALALARIITGLLPSTLGTDFAARRYTVAAELTRQPTRTELALIDGALPGERLGEAGYAEVSLKMRDRRLEIRDASLDQLADGLAVAIDTLLGEVSADATAKDAETDAEAARLAKQEDERARYVATAAAAIEFVAAPAG